MNVAPVARVRCVRCRKPAAMCYCALIPRLETTTRVVILQHTRERDMPIGTARMASLCLPQAELHVGVDWSERASLRRALGDPARPPILLYPGPGARDILREPPRGPVTLVVVDGTWAQARRVVRDNSILAALPRYAFTAPEPSRYRIRREPRAEYCSTIEALMHVLGVLEGDPARFRALLAPFEAMIDAQIACEASAPAQRPRIERARAPRSPLPAVIDERWDDLVCIAAEAQPPDELIHWLAYRPSDAARFEAIATPASPIAASTSFISELTEAQLAAGAPIEEVRDRFARFVRSSDILCTWGPRALALYGGALPAGRLDLRAVAHRHAGRKVGSLEDYAGVVPPLAAGRAGRRLALLAHLLQGWRR